jgi:hypothetical protein
LNCSEDYWAEEACLRLAAGVRQALHPILILLTTDVSYRASKVRLQREAPDMAHGDDSHKLKPWREIAAEIAPEQDSAKLLQLVKQLLDALDERVP